MKLVILDPGHFHAALVQKTMIAGVDRTVRVYAPGGPELDDYLARVAGYNARAVNPTDWKLEVHAGRDFLERFAADRAGDVVVISGNNRRKGEYIARAVAAGMHTLADKPMAIEARDFDALAQAFDVARANGVLLYDIMTERHEITTMLQKAFSAFEPVFGTPVEGTPDNPAVTKESVHHFSKLVSGVPIRRPPWFFDVAQQGEGLVDITTHLVDLVQWECFPDLVLDHRRDVHVFGARRWPTTITPAQFGSVTGLVRYPEWLGDHVRADGSLDVYANGEIDYRLQGVHARVSVRWNFEAPPGGGDTHFSVMRGTRSDLVIRQGEAEGYQPVLSVEPHPEVAAQSFAGAMQQALSAIGKAYPGVDARRAGDVWQVLVPAPYHVGHEAHFGQVTAQFLQYVAAGALPDWEVPSMLTKYRTTTDALALARTGPR